MLRHTGKKRTYSQNIKLATLLCLTAGFVNVSGLLGFLVFTTNVTGHAAVFAEKLATRDFHGAEVVGLWMLLFLAGAFFSSLYIRHNAGNRRAFIVPVFAEIVILVVVGTVGTSFNRTPIETTFFAGSLLFAMGMQNAMVTVISGFDVRTTHLTGMFTDLGIDCASWLYDTGKRKEATRQKIRLRLVIIFFFLLGAILGGYIFNEWNCHTFYIPAAILVVVILYDIVRLKVLRLIHRLRG